VADFLISIALAVSAHREEARCVTHQFTAPAFSWWAFAASLPNQPYQQTEAAFQFDFHLADFFLSTVLVHN
jgi:hypothetical protein